LPGKYLSGFQHQVILVGFPRPQKTLYLNYLRPPIRGAFVTNISLFFWHGPSLKSQGRREISSFCGSKLRKKQKNIWDHVLKVLKNLP